MAVVMLPSTSHAGWLLWCLSKGFERLELLISILRLRCIVSFKPHDSRHGGRRRQIIGTLVAEGRVAYFADFLWSLPLTLGKLLS